ncbi:MAG: ABC transporter permease [Acidobacteriota bacterium]
MPFEVFIALRYLRAKRRQAAVSVLTGISIVGITAGVAALIVAQALITGFRSDVQEKILAGTAHLNLLRKDSQGIENYRSLIERVSAVPGVRAVSATTYEPVLLTIADRQEQAILKGVDTSARREANEVFRTTIEGDASLIDAEDQDGREVKPMVIGKELARVLGLHLEEVVTAVSARTRLTPLGVVPRPRFTRFRIAGIFSSGLFEYDSKWAYISLRAVQQLRDDGRTAGVIQMKVDDIYAVEETGARVLAVAGSEFMTTNWKELNRPLFAALELQQRVVIVFFSLLIVMAALNIITTLTMTVIEKHRDIAILRAQGATSRSIMMVFVWQGAIVGAVGAALGTAAGLGTAWLANRYHLVSIPAEIYSVSSVTLQPGILDTLAVAGLALAISLLATIYPARKAARLLPVEALRYE